MKCNYLKALLEYPCHVVVHWHVDQPQADPIQDTWDWEQAKEELRGLLQQKNSADRFPPPTCSVHKIPLEYKGEGAWQCPKCR